jgi:hypothetical protein
MADLQSAETMIVTLALKDSSYKQQLISSTGTARVENQKSLVQKLPGRFKVQVL